MFRFLHHKAMLLAIRRNKRLYRRTRKLYNLKDAQSIGIVFEAVTPDDFTAVQEFYKHIARDGKTVRVAGYVHSREIPSNYLFKNDFHFFDRKMLNWYKKPLDSDIIAFLRTPFHILIDLTLENRNCIRYIVDSCPASFKVGRYTQESQTYDLMIRMEESVKLPFLISQIEHYLDTINRPELSPNIVI